MVVLLIVGEMVRVVVAENDPEWRGPRGIFTDWRKLKLAPETKQILRVPSDHKLENGGWRRNFLIRGRK